MVLWSEDGPAPAVRDNSRSGVRGETDGTFFRDGALRPGKGRSRPLVTAFMIGWCLAGLRVGNPVTGAAGFLGACPVYAGERLESCFYRAGYLIGKLRRAFV